MSFLLFTTPTCPNCPQAKLLIKEQLPDEKVENIDATTEAGFERARQFQVSQVPTLIELDDFENIIQDHRGIGAIYNHYSTH